MARASIRTMLPLDRFAQILGIDPRHFNQVTSELAPVNACKQVWIQHSWQAADQVGREEVAEAIARAEDDISAFLGYYPLPQYIVGEVERTSQVYDVAARGLSTLEDAARRFQSVKGLWGHIISGGIEARDIFASPTIGAGLEWQDLDGDGYFETMQIEVNTAVTDPDELRVYFHDELAEDEWEIRPLRSVTIAAGVATILIDRHLLVLPDLWEALNPEEVDGDDDDNFVTQVDVAWVRLDPSQQVQLQWERLPSTCDCGAANCAMCAWAVQWGCLQTRDPRLGFVTYQPGEWDAANEQFTPTPLSVSRQPERVRLWYKSGWRWVRTDRPSQLMDPALERMITLYAITLLDRPICGCSNVEAFYERWTEDRALVAGSQTGSARYQMSKRDISCPWGTKTGAIQAYNIATRLALGQAVRY